MFCHEAFYESNFKYHMFWGYNVAFLQKSISIYIFF